MWAKRINGPLFFSFDSTMTGILRGGTVETERNLRIGVDCGGTNTDAVILDLTPNAADVVLGATKSPTTPEVTHGIQHAITKVLEQSVDIRAEAIQAVSIGTTHFVNALISRSTDRLARVAVIRLCGPFTRATAPFAGFPFELREILQGPTFMVEGGLQIDGSEISQIQEAEIEEACREIQSQVSRICQSVDPALMFIGHPIDCNLRCVRSYRL